MPRTSDSDTARIPDAVQLLVGLAVGFVVLSCIGLFFLAWQVRTVFWKTAGDQGPEAWRNYLMQLPLGVPEGTVKSRCSRARTKLAEVLDGFDRGAAVTAVPRGGNRGR